MEFSPRVSRITLRESSVKIGSLLFMLLPFTGCSSKVSDSHSSPPPFFISPPILFQASAFQEAITILEIHVMKPKKKSKP